MPYPFSGESSWSSGCVAVQQAGWLTWIVAICFYAGLLVVAIVYNLIVIVSVMIRAKTDKRLLKEMSTQSKNVNNDAAALGDVEAAGESATDAVVVLGRRNTAFYASTFSGIPVASDTDSEKHALPSGSTVKHLWCLQTAAKPCCCCFKYFHMAHGTFGRAAAVTLCCNDLSVWWKRPNTFGRATWLHKAGPWNQACHSTFCTWFCAPWIVPLHTIATSCLFDTIVTVLILVNSVTLCLDTCVIVFLEQLSNEYVYIRHVDVFTRV